MNYWGLVCDSALISPLERWQHTWTIEVDLFESGAFTREISHLTFLAKAEEFSSLAGIEANTDLCLDWIALIHLIAASL